MKKGLVTFSLAILVIFLMAGCAKTLELPPDPEEPPGVIGRVLQIFDLGSLGKSGNFIVRVEPDPLVISETGISELKVTVKDSIVLKRGLQYIPKTNSYKVFEFDTGGNIELRNPRGAVYLAANQQASTPITVEDREEYERGNFSSNGEADSIILVFSCTKGTAGAFNCHSGGGSKWLSSIFNVVYAGQQQQDFDLKIKDIKVEPAVPIREGLSLVNITVEDTTNRLTNGNARLFADFTAGDNDIGLVRGIFTEANGPNIDANFDGNVGFGHENIGSVTVGTAKSFWINVSNADPIRIRAIADPALGHASFLAPTNVQLTATGQYKETDEVNNNNNVTPKLQPAIYHSNLKLRDSNASFNETPIIVGHVVKLTVNVTDESDLQTNKGRELVPVFSFGTGVDKICADPSCATDLDTDNDGMIMGQTSRSGPTGFADDDKKAIPNVVVGGAPYSVYVVYSGGETLRRVTIYLDGTSMLKRDNTAETSKIIEFTPRVELPPAPEG